MSNPKLILLYNHRPKLKKKKRKIHHLRGVTRTGRKTNKRFRRNSGLWMLWAVRWLRELTSDVINSQNIYFTRNPYRHYWLPAHSLRMAKGRGGVKNRIYCSFNQWMNGSNFIYCCLLRFYVNYGLLWRF